MAEASLLRIRALGEGQVRELHALYQGEWWTAGRELPDIRRMLAHTDLLFGYQDRTSGRLLAFARVLVFDGATEGTILDYIPFGSFQGGAFVSLGGRAGTGKGEIEHDDAGHHVSGAALRSTAPTGKRIPRRRSGSNRSAVTCTQGGEPMSPSPRKHDTVTAATARRSKRVAVVALAAMRSPHAGGEGRRVPPLWNKG